MREHMTLGSTPCDEPCAGVGADDYFHKSHEECKRYIALLTEKFGPIPMGCSFRKKSFPHDFGTYYEVCVFYDDEDEVGSAFALHCEEYLPHSWADNEKVPFVAPKRSGKLPALDMEELEQEAHRLLGGSEFGD